MDLVKTFSHAKKSFREPAKTFCVAEKFFGYLQELLGRLRKYPVGSRSILLLPKNSLAIDENIYGASTSLWPPINFNKAVLSVPLGSIMVVALLRLHSGEISSNIEFAGVGWTFG